MKLIFLGDSITEGVGASGLEKCYVAQVGKKLNCTVLNYGISGTRIAKQKKLSFPASYDMDFQLRASLMEKDADKVFVFGGTNDYGHGDALIGNYNEKNPYTFYGGLRCLIENLIGIYGAKKICFLLPLRRFEEIGVNCKGINGNESGKGLSVYVEILKEVLHQYGIDYIDLYENGIPKPQSKTGDKFTVDGLHPNDDGHKIIADKICEYLKKTSL